MRKANVGCSCRRNYGRSSYRRTVIWVLDKGVAAYIPLVAKAMDNMNTAPVCRDFICAQEAKPCEGTILAIAMAVDFSPAAADTALKANTGRQLSRATVESVSDSQQQLEIGCGQVLQAG